VLIGNQGDTEGRKAPVSGTFGDTPIPIVGVPISYDLMIELSEIEGLVMLIDTDTLDGRVLAPQARPRVAWHLAEVLLPIVGGVDPDGNSPYFGDWRCGRGTRSGGRPPGRLPLSVQACGVPAAGTSVAGGHVALAVDGVVAALTRLHRPRRSGTDRDPRGPDAGSSLG